MSDPDADTQTTEALTPIRSEPVGPRGGEREPGRIGGEREPGRTGERAAERCVAFGWAWLALSACGGLALEVAHGLKLGAFLDVEGVRTMLRLAHAHGVGSSLVLIAFGATAAPRLGERTSSTAIAILVGAVLVPVGFAAGAIGHDEVDPGVGVWLVPFGALSLIVGLVRTAVAAVGYVRRNQKR